MTKELVYIENKKCYTDSILVGEEFDISHNNLLKKIRKIESEIDKNSFSDMFILSSKKNSQNREFDVYKMNRDGYMFLVMNISTSKAHQKKLMFIKAFNLMEQKLLSLVEPEWQKVRNQSKENRLAETDVIKEFVDYATNQGSKSAHMYYMNYSKATNKALGIIASKDNNTRDLLDKMQLHQLILCEDLIKRIIKSEMNKNEHYKVIFEKCKVGLSNFANSLLIGIEDKQIDKIN